MEPDAQLELFDLPDQPVTRRETFALGSFHVRHDHAVLMGIVGLIGVSVVYALGVDRGKELTRAELSLQNVRADVKTGAAPSESSGTTPNASTPQRSSSSQPQPPTRPTTPLTTPRPKLATSKITSTTSVTAKTLARTDSKFAIQIVSYSQPALAQRELQRLRQRGEQAFALNTGGRTVLLIGPFQTKDRAGTKLADLKRQYQGCFVRAL